MLLKRTTVILSAVAAAGAAVVVAASPASADPTVAGTYNTITPTRVLDTRSGVGTPKAALGAGQTLVFNSTANLGPLSASAVDLTVTAVAPTRSGYLTAYAGATRPTVGTVNFTAGQDTPNEATLAVDDTGIVSVYNGSAGTVQVVIDMSGYWTGGTVDPDNGGTFQALAVPQRAVDSRTTTAIPSGGNATVPIAGTAGVPSTGATAVAVDLGAVAPTRAGYATVTGGSTDQTADNRTTSVQFSAGQTRTALSFVPLAEDGSISVYNGSGAPLNYVVDVLGYVNGGTPSAGGSFLSTTPDRSVDSRATTPVAAKATTKVALFADDGTSSIFAAVAVHVTAIGGATGGFFTAWQGTSPRPNTSAVNFGARETRTGSAIVPVNADGTISLYNGSTSSTNYIVDIQGYVLNSELAGTSDAVAQRRIDTALKHVAHAPVR